MYIYIYIYICVIIIKSFTRRRGCPSWGIFIPSQNIKKIHACTSKSSVVKKSS